MRCFFADTGIEVPTVTAGQMREIDCIAMEETGPNLFRMMENAGRSLALLAMETLGSGWRHAKVVVLAGSGGNGGGGIRAARHFANRGVDVRLCLAATSRLAEAAAFQRKIFRGTSGKEVRVDALGHVAMDFILDALIGHNLHTAARGVARELIQWANGTKGPVLSLDGPTGVNSTTGQIPGVFIKARWTITLALPNTGLVPERTGILIVADIGIPGEVFRRLGLAYIPPFGNRFKAPPVSRCEPITDWACASSGHFGQIGEIA